MRHNKSCYQAHESATTCSQLSRRLKIEKEQQRFPTNPSTSMPESSQHGTSRFKHERHGKAQNIEKTEFKKRKMFIGESEDAGRYENRSHFASE